MRTRSITGSHDGTLPDDIFDLMGDEPMTDLEQRANTEARHGHREALERAERICREEIKRGEDAGNLIYAQGARAVLVRMQQETEK